MASLSDQDKAIIKKYPIGRRLTTFHEDYSEFVSEAPSKPSFNGIASLAIKDQGASRLIVKLLSAMLGLDAAADLPPHYGSPRKSLTQDLADLVSRFPQPDNIEAVGILLERVIEQSDNDELIWSAVYELFTTATPPRSKSTSPTMVGDRFVGDLYDAWRWPYFKDSLVALRQQMQHCIDDKSDYYAKTLVFVQSSGMGKSRLADRFGESCPMINFILRENEGYPPGDSEILAFMCEKPPKELSDAVSKSPSKPKSGGEDRPAFNERRTVAIWNHSVAVSLLKASFETFNAWVENWDSTKTTLEGLAAIRHKQMAPLDPKRKVTGDPSDGRSQCRINFCQTVAREALRNAHSLAMKGQWRKHFVQENEPTVRESIKGSEQVESLKEAAEKLIDNLQKFCKGNTASLPLVVVFDEATNLFSNIGSGNIDTGRYVALNRVLSCLTELPIWFFMLSTESRVENLLPTEKAAAAVEVKGIDRWSNPSGRRPPLSKSGRIDYIRLRLFPPFVSFRLDIEDRKRMSQSKSKAEELSKRMADFSKAKHIAMFGRPLWFAYNGPDKLHKVAEWKLLGGRKDSRFDPADKHHVLAALSFRLSLDVCIENPVSLDLVRTAVNSHLRVVISMDQRTGVLSTATPSEPVLALAAMRLLCQGKNWTTSIKTLTGELLQQGLVAKGIKGELFARLVMILASDQIRLDSSSQAGIQVSEEEDLACEEGGQASEEENLASEEEYSVKSTFMVYEFLMSLFAEKHHALIQGIPEQILKAKMNFTHFVAAGEHLSPSIFPDLCHDLLRRSAALQLCENQATYDQLIPIYFGDDQKPFDPSQCGVVLIQNKNRERATSLNNIFKEHFVAVGPDAGSPSKQPKTQKSPKGSIREGPYFVFDNTANPILFLLFDTGVQAIKSPLLEVSYSISDKDPRVWAVHSRGHTSETFGCLERMDSAGNAGAFFASVMENVGIYANIARENVGFGRLARRFRYAKIEDDIKEADDSEKNIALDVEEFEDDGDRDTPMPDVQLYGLQ